MEKQKRLCSSVHHIWRTNLRNVQFEGSSESELSTFVKENFHGLVGHRTQDTIRDFKNPLIVAYYSVDYVKNPKGTNYWRNRQKRNNKATAQKMKHELNEYGYDFVGDKPVIPR